MKQINYLAVIKEKGTKRRWIEFFSDLVVDEMTNLQHAKFMIKRFNQSLRKSEFPRKVIRVRNSHKRARIRHDWKKVSLVTEKGGFDKYKCLECGATGKRYGLAEFVTPDRKFTIYCT